MSDPTLCALCAEQEAADSNYAGRFATTGVGPLPTCGEHVDAALDRLGYTKGAESAGIVGFLEQVDPAELQSAAAELMSDYAEGAVGRAYLSVLISGAKELAGTA